MRMSHFPLDVYTTVNQRLAGLGTNTLAIQSGATSRNGAFGAEGTAQTLTMSDVQALATIPHMANISPVIGVGTQVIYPTICPMQGCHQSNLSMRNLRL